MSPMTTHRSLNKLEYKAHMSIHNTAEVASAENEMHESAFTRDRLGRRHKLFEGDGTSRIFKPAALSALFLFLAAGVCFAVPENIQVTSDEVDSKDFNERLGMHEREERFAFYRDGDSSVGINDNGDPNVAMRF